MKVQAYIRDNKIIAVSALLPYHPRGRDTKYRWRLIPFVDLTDVSKEKSIDTKQGETIK